MSRRESVSWEVPFSGGEDPISLKKKAWELSATFSFEQAGIYYISTTNSVPCPVRQEALCVNQMRLEVQLLCPELQELVTYVHIAETW